MMKLARAKLRGIFSMLPSGDVRVLFARYSDIALATLVALIVGMLIVPLPTFLLDLLISLNIGAAVTMLLIAIYVSDALKIATFPTLLLITTLFRLAIEVSATRLILLKANAGTVIHAFGNFVVAGNLVVGVVVFVVLTMIQFIVIANGSGRVAEVGARFTLDAMPGKQMSIDAELRSGHIDPGEARHQRALLARESQFFGSMDGAMKFVKGDAIAGVVVLLTNIVGGLAIGMIQKGMDLSSAVRTYTLLTIGEGLVSQIPALVISTAAGIIVTRVSSEDEGGHLGDDIGRQILAQPKALAISATLLVLLALVPGLPTAPFLTLGGLLGLLAYRLIKTEKTSAEVVVEPDDDGSIATLPATNKRARRSEIPVPALVPVAIEMSAILTEALLPKQGPNRIASQWVPALRKRFFRETGITVPAIRLDGHVVGLAPGAYAIRLREVPVASGQVVVDGAMSLDTPERLRTLGIAAEPTMHPDGRAAAWITAPYVAMARAGGLALLSPDEVIVEHLFHVLRRHGHTFVGIQETQTLLDGLASTHPVLVREVVPKLVTPVLIADILHRLAEEGISLRNLPEILAALAERTPRGDSDPALLTDCVRAALRRQITFNYASPDGTVAVFLLDSMIEETVREAIQNTGTGSHLALEPIISRDIVEAVGRAISGVVAPVILTAGDIRRHVRGLVESKHPRVAVIANQELVPEAKLRTLGNISL
jgi:type III secretion protein V